MKLIKRFFFMVLLIFMSTGVISCNDDDDDSVTPIQVTASFEKESVDVVIGKTYKQAVTTNCPDANIEYSSSDQSVATVNPKTGEITALAKGSTTITATVSAPKGSSEYAGTKTASYHIDAYYNKLGTITIDFNSSFSPDLLELITPIVSYRDKDGEHDVRLDKDACKYIKEEYNFDDDNFTLEFYRWAPSIECNIYETIDFDETISIHFESRKQNIEENRKYELFVDAGITSVKQSFTYNDKPHNGSSNYYSISIDINIGDGETHDDDIYEGESVQKYIDEIVKTKQEFRVEVSKDGQTKVNGK